MKPGALIAKKYRLTRRLGGGAMGVVWAAINEQTSGEVALKFLLRSTDDLRMRLAREARAAGGLKHPNVIEIYDVGETDDGDPFLVMPLLSGETLGELLERKRRLEPQEAARIGRDIARALTVAHAKQIIHRDLKPANIFLQQLPDADVPVVKVLDFGVSKNLEVSDGLSTVAGGTVGSPAYMSPEQARADRSVDHRADLWSLGVLLFEMLAGVRPFQGDSNQLIVKIATGDIPRLSRCVWNIDPMLDALVARCLERDRDQRISLATDLVRELDRFANPGAPGPTPGQLSPIPPAMGTPRPLMGSRPEIDPGTRSPRLDGLVSVASAVDDDEDGLAATARLDPHKLAAAMAARPQPASAARPEPVTTPQQRYAVTAPLSGHVPSMGPQFAANSPPPMLPSGAPATGQHRRAFTGTLPMQNAPLPPDATRGGESSPITFQPPSGHIGYGTSAGPAVEGPSAARRVGVSTVKLTSDIGDKVLEQVAAGRASTSSTAPLLKTPTVDPALSSNDALLLRRRRALFGVVVSLSVVALGLGGAVLYTLLSSPRAAQSASTAPSAASPAPSAVETAALPLPIAPPLPAVTASASATAGAQVPATTSTLTSTPRKPGPLPRSTSAPLEPKPSSTTKVPDWLRERR